MLPANQLAGFGDLSFNSHPHPFSHFNSAQIPFSYPNTNRFHLELHDPNGGEEEDEWAVYASSRVTSREKIGSGGGLQAGSSQKPEDNIDEWGMYASSRVASRDYRSGDLKAGSTQKSEDNLDEWGTFASSSGGDRANHMISPELSSEKLDNGGLQGGPAWKGEDWGLFISSPVESQPKGNGGSSISSSLNQKNNGGLQTGLTENENWGLFNSYTGSTTNLTPTHQTSDKKDRIDELQANPSQLRTLVKEEEDEEWGTFVSTPVAPQANNNSSNGSRTSNFEDISQRRLGNVTLHVRPIDHEEEWGEFVSSPIASGTKNEVTSSSSVSPSVKWEKPKGPIPLSFFGGEEEELVQEDIKLETLPNLSSRSNLSSDTSPSSSSGVVKENILDHHGGIENLELKNIPSLKINGHDVMEEAATTSSLNGSTNATTNLGSTDEKAVHSASRWDPFVNSKNEVVEEAWEFKDGSSDITNSAMASPQKEDLTNSWASFSPSNEQAVSSSAIKLKDGIFSLYTETDHSEKKTRSVGLLTKNKMTVHDADQIYLSKSAKDSVQKFYRRLQEGSLLLISHHIKEYKKAPKVITFARQKVKEEKREEEIQEAYRELKNLNVSILNLENSSRDACINELLNTAEEVFLQNFEREYQLSTKILLAVENLGAALDLLKHSLTTINALEMVSTEGISTYISVWYSLISACSEELQNGASIWAQSFNAGLSDELVSSGEYYFLALGEIYRIVEILRVTLKRFSSLLLLSNQNRLKELDMCLDICSKAWGSGLDAALETISDGNSASAPNAKSLAGSIKKIREVDIRNDYFCKEKVVCKLCLLPLALLPEMKSITWHGDQYILKIVNLWANKISPEPPILPSIRM